ncbi:M48 metallopeptidase family protein [Bacillus aerolatus]|nr:M48 family metallopeptidase [Bacillus aerolatus]
MQVHLFFLLNWRIFLAPVSMVDYVLAHELAHLKEMNHTQAYWGTSRVLLPDYEERKEWLQVNGGQLYV